MATSPGAPFLSPRAREVIGKSQVRFLFQSLLLLTAQLTDMPGINISIDLSINIQIFSYIYIFPSKGLARIPQKPFP